MNAALQIALVSLAVPRIGQVWPEQGGIFGGIAGGKEGQPFYALIVPTDPRASFNEVELGTYNTLVEGADSKSDGLANTKAFAAAGSKLCQDILALDIDGHQDWFLPSADEARVLCANVPELFEFDDYYWTSTQFGRYRAFVQVFEDGYHDFDSKILEHRARAVRKIQLSD